MSNKTEALLLIIRAMRKGVMLGNVEVWKNAAVAIAALTSLLSALAGIAVRMDWIGQEIDPQLIMELSSALVTVVTLILAYFGVATTEKIGYETSNKPHSGNLNGSKHELRDNSGALSSHIGSNTNRPDTSASDSSRSDWGVG